MIKDIKLAIIARLQPLRDRVRIVADDTEGESGSNANVKSDFTLRVSYAGGNFNTPDGGDDVPIQIGDRSFQVLIEVKDLRTEDKATALLEDAENLLLGFCPCVAGVIGEFYLTSDRFLQNKDNIYYYSLNLTVPVRVFKNYSGHL